MKTFKLTLTIDDGVVLDHFEIALADSAESRLESCEETVGGYGSANLLERLKVEMRKYI